MKNKAHHLLDTSVNVLQYNIINTKKEASDTTNNQADEDNEDWSVIEDRCNEERMLELSLVRLIEVIGEAAARVTSAGRKKYGSILL